MIAKSLLESSRRSDRLKSTRASSGEDTNDDLTFSSGDERRVRASMSAKDEPVVTAPDFSVRALRSLMDRGRVIDAGRSTGRRPETTKTIDCEIIKLVSERTAARSDKGDAQVIFVFLMPECNRGGRYQELAVEPLRLDGRGAATGASLEVDLPFAVRQSAVRDLVFSGLSPASFEPAGPRRESDRPDAAPARLPKLTPREREILQMILEGHPNKNIAADLRISRRTVENHRAKVMKKTGSRSLPALVRLAIAAGAMPAASPAAPR